MNLLENFISVIPDNILNNDDKYIFYKISNNFEEVKDNYKDVFSIICYYLENNLCKIIVRRLDQNSGWGKDLKIILYSIDNNQKQTISIGSHTCNTKIIEVHTDFILEKESKMINVNQRKIIQAKENNSINNYQEYLNLTDLIYENSNLNYEFFSVAKQREFIKNNFEKYLDKYDLLYNCYYKYIIFICCYIYLNGGIYISNNVKLLIEIKNIDIAKNSYYIDNDNNNNNNENNNEILFLNSEKNNLEVINYLESILNNINDNIFNNINNYFKNFIEFKNIKNYNINNNINNNIKNYIINDDNIFKINNYKFIMNSDIKYKIIYLDENYYLLKPVNKYNIIEKDMFITCINETTNVVINLEIKTEKNNYKTNNVFFFTIL